MINNIKYNLQVNVEKDGKQQTQQIHPRIVLNKLGAVLQVVVTHPKIIIDEYQKNNKVAPHLVVKALIDTGASNSIIKPEIAQQLNLTHTGYQKINSVQNQQRQPVYYGRLQFHWNVGKDIPIASCPLPASFYDCLIGRDILQHWCLTYNGVDGSLIICD